MTINILIATLRTTIAVTFRALWANATPPVIWLATGNVEIHGNVILNGETGRAQADVDNAGEEAKGGPGGFAGGLGGGDGYGPGGGVGHVGSRTLSPGKYSGVYGNQQLQPLVGGPGGGGNIFVGILAGGGGGCAILISSSGTIEITGSLSCDGDSGGFFRQPGTDNAIQAAQGSGGAIRLLANKILGDGTLSAAPEGRIAIEAFDVQDMALTTDPTVYHLNLMPTSTFSKPVPTITITHIDGQPAATPSLGRTEMPDVIFSNAEGVTTNLECANIPVGTTLTVAVKVSINGSSETFATTSTPLSGTFEQSTATATLTLPQGPGGPIRLGKGCNPRLRQLG